jgi:hypothetical protein
MSILKKLATPTLCALLCGCPTSPKIAECMDPEQTSFNEEVAQLRESHRQDHLIGVGQHRDKETAKNLAFGDLAQQIKSRVVSKTQIVASEFMTKIRSEIQEESSHALSVVSDVELIGAEPLVADRQNSCQEFQVVYRLPRHNVPAILKQAEERAQEKSIAQRQTLTSLLVRYEYAASQQGRFRLFQEGDSLRSGDFYRIVFESSEAVYVYIFQFDSANKIYRLFPKGEFEGEDPNNTNPVARGRTYFVPGEDISFELDEQIGRETLHIIVSKEPDSSLDSHYQQIVAMQQNLSNRDQIGQIRAETETAFKWRGPKKKVAYHKSSSGMFKQVDLCEGCVYSLDFYHKR